MSAASAGTNVKSVERVLRLLEIVSVYRDGVSFVKLEQSANLPKSTLHGLLQTMIELRWLTIDVESRKYSIGVRAWEVGSSYSLGREVTVRARPFMQKANLALGETIQLAILDDLDVVYLDKIEGKGPLRLVSEVGSRLPAYVTAIGKIMLAALPNDVLAERFSGVSLEQFTAKTIGTGEELLRVLERARTAGFAEDDGEYTPGVTCVGVPIHDSTGKVIAAISCSVPTARVDVGDITRATMLSEISTQAAAISASLVHPLIYQDN